jgi:acyl-CoA synthetase (AMP-forming)/AMP-acid ligase II
MKVAKSLFGRIQQRCRDEEHSFFDLSASSETGSHEAAALMKLAERIGCYLGKSKGNSIVVICCDQLSTFIPSFWGCLAAGVTPLPVTIATSPKNPNHQDLRELALLLSICGPVSVIVDEKTACLRDKLQQASSIQWLLFSDLVCKQESSLIPAKGNADIAFILTTSGTTGNCKYAAFSGAWFDYEVSNSRRVLTLFPLGSSTGIGFGYVLNRLSAYLPLREAVRNPDSLLAFIEQHQIEVVIVPPTMVTILLKYFTEASTPLVRRNLESLVKLNIGSSTIPLYAVEQLRSHLLCWGASKCRIHFAYGLTETGGVSYGPFRGTTFHAHAEGLRIGPVSPGVEVRIGTEDPGTPGPIAVRRAFTFLGYLQPQVGSGWVLEPFQSGVEWFQTGDIGLIDSDGLVLSGREKDTIVINSRKIALGAIERLIEGMWPDLFEVAIAIATSDERLLIFAVLASEASDMPIIKLQELIGKSVHQHFGIAVADLIPIQFSEIPRTATGKVLKNNLLHGWKKLPTKIQGIPRLIDEAQTTPIAEQLLRELRQHASQFKMSDPSLRLSVFGVDSLALAQIIGRVERRSGLSCNLDDCPPDPKVIELAALFHPPAIADSVEGSEINNTNKQTLANNNPLKDNAHTALAHEIQAANLQLGGEQVGPQSVVRRFNSAAKGTPLVLLGNIATPIVTQIADNLSNHPIYYIRVLHVYRDASRRKASTRCYLDWLLSCLDECHPILVGFCLAGTLTIDLAKELWGRNREARLTLLMDWNSRRDNESDPYYGNTVYHIHEHFHRRLAEKQRDIQADLLRLTPNMLFTYWGTSRKKTPERYFETTATLEILIKILRHELVKPILTSPYAASGE